MTMKHYTSVGTKTRKGSLMGRKYERHKTRYPGVYHVGVEPPGREDRRGAIPKGATRGGTRQGGRGGRPLDIRQALEEVEGMQREQARPGRRRQPLSSPPVICIKRLGTRFSPSYVG